MGGGTNHDASMFLFTQLSSVHVTVTQHKQNLNTRRHWGLGYQVTVFSPVRRNELKDKQHSKDENSHYHLSSVHLITGFSDNRDPEAGTRLVMKLAHLPLSRANLYTLYPAARPGNAHPSVQMWDAWPAPTTKPQKPSIRPKSGCKTPVSQPVQAGGKF